MKKYGLILFLSLILTGLFAEEWTVATSYNTKFSYEDIVDFFIEECEKSHFDNVMWTYKVYTEEKDQKLTWQVNIKNDGYTYSENGDKKRCLERSVLLRTTNGWLCFNTFDVPTKSGTFISHKGDWDEEDIKNRADFLAESFKWLQRYNKSWDIESIRAFDKLFEYTDYTNMLSFSAGHNLSDIVLCLLKNGVDVNARDSYGETALHYAARSGNRNIARILIQAFADLDVQDKSGGTPLFEAVRADAKDVVQLLVQVGADINKTNKPGMNALCYAWDIEITRILVKAGSELNPGNNSFLFNLIGHMNLDDGAAECMKGQIKIILEQKKEKLEESDLQTALIIAAYYNQVDKIQNLISKGADVNTCNIDNVTPLMLAALNNSLDAAEFLVKNGANVNYVSSPNKNSAIRIAVSFSSNEVAEFLIKNGLTEEIRMSAYRAACISNNLKIKELIINCDENEAYKKKAKHNIEVMIDGKPYYYFMTDDKELFKYELAKFWPNSRDIEQILEEMWETTTLSNQVKNKMRELECCYAYTESYSKTSLIYCQKDGNSKIFDNFSLPYLLFYGAIDNVRFLIK